MGNVFSRGNEIEELRRENQSLKNINAQLEQRLLTRPPARSTVDITQPFVSTIDIDKYIDELLQDPTINIQYFPDSIERGMYRNILGLTVNLIRKMATDTSLNVLGHSIHLVMVPNSSSSVVPNSSST